MNEINDIKQNNEQHENLEKLEKNQENNINESEQISKEKESKKQYSEDLISHYRNEIRKISKERDTYKQKVRELESLKAIEQEYINLKQEYENIINQIKEKENQKRNQLLEKIKQNKDVYEVAEKIEDINALEKFINLYFEKKFDDAIISKNIINDNKTKIKTWDDYSSIELARIKKENPELYKQLKKQRFSN